MFERIVNLCKSSPDETKELILKLFDFLINNYGFEFAKEKLGDARDQSGKFFFHGPLNVYQIYNDNVCINILHLVQRDDYNVYITDRKSIDQVYIRSGIEVPSHLAYDFPLLAREIRESVLDCGEVFGYKI